MLHNAAYLARLLIIAPAAWLRRRCYNGDGNGWRLKKKSVAARQQQHRHGGVVAAVAAANQWRRLAAAYHQANSDNGEGGKRSAKAKIIARQK